MIIWRDTQADEVATAYTSNGKASSVTDAEGNKTSYVYDGFDRLSQTQYPPTTKGAGTSNSSDYEQLGYDANGNVTSRRLRDTHSISYTYDALNRLTVKSVPASPGGASAYSVYYGYELGGPMTFARFSSTTGSGITNTYDALGRLATTATNMDGTTRTTTPTYDLSGNRTALNASSGYAITFSRDTLGRLTSVQEPSGSTPLLAQVGYNGSGLTSSVAYGPSGASSISASYDSVGRLTSVGHDLAGTTYDDSLGFSYNPASQIKQNTRLETLNVHFRTGFVDRRAGPAAWRLSRPERGGASSAGELHPFGGAGQKNGARRRACARVARRLPQGFVDTGDGKRVCPPSGGRRRAGLGRASPVHDGGEGARGAPAGSLGFPE
ncbi:MAG: hypothetical protein QOG84_299 [Sphingomonadales bacterium]|nr:hypothetical protein [Sphingomonadales bacterium]